MIEKSWKIKETLPVCGRIEKATQGYYRIRIDKMQITYDTFMSLCRCGAMIGEVYASMYDFVNGECTYLADTLKQIQDWEQDTAKGVIYLDYSQVTNHTNS